MTAPEEGRDRTEDGVLAEIVAEVSERLQRGEDVDPGEYEAQAASLRQLLPMLKSMALLKNESTAARRPTHLGDYRIIREAGRGGMGVVYEAEQISLGRRVALKVLLHAAALDERQVHRFNVEIQTAAVLDHPHIVPLLTSGAVEGVPYYTMRFIEGTDLGKILQLMRPKDPAVTVADQAVTIAGNPLESTGATFHQGAARIGVQAAEALAHAHAAEVLHRDIKPSNLLVDRSGKLWITDFGLARVSNDQDLTRTGDIVGTPRYMSPEQAMGKRTPLDGRTDVYSLGATLYELLTLRPAFGGADRLTVLQQIAQDDPIPPRRIDPTIPIDLETIVLRSMAKSPGDRYATAADLAADLRRFLDNRPIRARRASAADWAFKWMLRHQEWAMGLAGLFVLLAVVVGLAGWRYNDILRSHNRALRDEIERADRMATEARYFASDAERQRRAAEADRTLADRHYFAAQLRLARQAVESKQFEAAQDLLEAVRPVPREGDAGPFAWHYLDRQARREIERLPDRPGKIEVMAVSADRSTLAAAYRDDSVVIWDLARGRQRRVIGDLPCTVIAISDDGRTLATIGPARDDGEEPSVRTWDTETGMRIGRCSLPPGTLAVPLNFALLAGGRLLAVEYFGTSTGPTTSVFPTGREPGVPPGRPLIQLPGTKLHVFIPDADFFTTRDDDRLIFRDARTGAAIGEILGRFKDGGLTAASEDRRWIAMVVPSHCVTILDREGVREVARRQFSLPIHSLALSGDGGIAAVSLDDGVVELWDRRAGTTRRIVPDDLPARRPLHQPAFSKDGRRIATSTFEPGGGAARASVWDVATGKLLGVLPSPDQHASPLYFSAGGRDLIVRGLRSPRIWHFDPPPDPPSPVGHMDEAWAVAYAPDSKALASGSDDTDDPQTIKLWDPATGRLIRGWNAGVGTVSALAYSPDGKILASGHFETVDSVRLWDPATGRRIAVIGTYPHWIRSVSFSPEGDRIAIGGGKGIADTGSYNAQICDVKTGRCVVELKGHANIVSSLAFSPDARTIVTASRDQTIRVWDSRTGLCLRTLQGSSSLVSARFSPDGKTIVSGDEAGVIAVHDADTLTVRRTLQNQGESLLHLAYSNDGLSLAASSRLGAIRLWDPLTGQELLTLKGHGSQVNGVAFAPDGSSLASCSHDGEVKLWRGRTPDDPAIAPAADR